MNTEREKSLRTFLAQYNLTPSSLDVIHQAFLHRSYAYEYGLTCDNERLEFLGDAVLAFVVVKYLYLNFPEYDEGELSKMKARLVSRSVLGRRAEEMELGPLLLLGKGEEQAGGRKRPVLLGSALEALIGALFLTVGFELVNEFILTHIIEPAAVLIHRKDFIDYKSKLQELVQKYYQGIPRYNTVSEWGPDHQKQFKVEVIVNGKIRGQGLGSRKKTAENLAAKEALEKIQTQIPE